MKTILSIPLSCLYFFLTGLQDFEDENNPVYPVIPSVFFLTGLQDFQDENSPVHSVILSVFSDRITGFQG